MERQNLIYIFADQWRAHAIGAAGEDDVFTPHMDAFAKESLSFTNAVSTYPLCSPHRASMLTGKYPYSCGMWTNCKTGLDEVLMLKPQETLISDVLWEQGYQTAYIGKWHLDASEQNFMKSPRSAAAGWDAYTPPGERRHHFDFWYSYGAMDQHLTPHYWNDTDEQIQNNKWSPVQETDVAIDYLSKRNKDKPFCVYLSWNPPHPPYDLLPEKFRKQYEGRELKFRENVPEELREDPEFIRAWKDYYGAVAGLDEQFGRLMEFLKEQGLNDNTVVVLSADHGDCMGSHGLMGKNIWYEESIRIPFYIRGQGIRAGTTDVLFSSQDHMPTLLDFLGMEIPDTVEGRSFAAVLRDEEIGSEPADAFLCMIPGMPEMAAEYHRYGLNQKAFGWRAIRTKEALYVVDSGTQPGDPQRRLLYDLAADPYQMHPVLLDPKAEQAIFYDNRLRHYFEQLNDPFLLHPHLPENMEGIIKSQ